MDEPRTPAPQLALREIRLPAGATCCIHYAVDQEHLAEWVRRVTDDGRYERLEWRSEDEVLVSIGRTTYIIHGQDQGATWEPPEDRVVEAF